MSPQPDDPTWLEASVNVPVSQLAHQSGFSVDELAELVKCGAIRPLQMGCEDLVFSPTYVSSLRNLCTLRTAHHLDLFTVGVLLGYAHRIEELEQEVRALKAHLPPHVVSARREGPPPWREPHATANACAIL